jgi:hypothetical protein
VLTTFHEKTPTLIVDDKVLYTHYMPPTTTCQSQDVGSGRFARRISGLSP